jgi:hypothetical protein
MVYWKNGQSGTLKFRTGADVVGTSDTNNGRILANSDGAWGTTTALQSTNDAVIMLEGTASLDCDNLDVRMRCANPTNARLRCYGTKYDFNGATAVDPVNDMIDLGTTPPSAGTLVMVMTASGTLPTGLIADTQYYVRAVSGNTCKLATRNSDTQIVDITADGSGTCTLYTGFSSGSATVNVLDDVTGDLWATSDTVVLANVTAGNYDQQHNITLNTINAGTVVLSATVDSDQNPGSSIWLSTRNCRILHSSTSSSQNIVENGSDCIFGEIRATSGTGTTFYCSAMYSGLGHTVTTISGCTYAMRYGLGHTVTTIYGCSNAMYSGSGHTVTTISGCNYAIYYGSHNYVKNLSGNTTDLRETGKIYARDGIIPANLVIPKINNVGYVDKLFSSHHQGVLDAYKIFQVMGNMTKVTAGAGSPIPDQRPGGNASLMELSNLQSNLDDDPHGVIAWDDDAVRVWATASSSKTYRFYVQSTFALSASELVLTGEYMDAAGDTETTTIDSDEAISVRSGITDWSNYVEVTINPARTGWVYFMIRLYKYSSGGQVFIDPMMVIS